MKPRLSVLGAIIVVAALAPMSAMASACDNCISVRSGPEPAAWALMLIGVGVIGAALRIARRKAL